MTWVGTYISANSFKLEDEDARAFFPETVRVFVVCSGVTIASNCASATYDGTDTTITLSSSVLTDPCGNVSVGGIFAGTLGNLPIHTHDDADQGGSGVKGTPPAHEWNGTQLRFRDETGAWGAYADLVGPYGISRATVGAETAYDDTSITIVEDGTDRFSAGTVIVISDGTHRDYFTVDTVATTTLTVTPLLDPYGHYYGDEYSTYPATTSYVLGTGEPGPVGYSLLPRGDWASSEDYLTLDLVSNNGSSYYCILAHTSDGTNEPGGGVYWETYWALSAEKGDQGDPLLWQSSGWVLGTTYTAYQTLEHNGSSYYCYLGHTASAANEPGIGASWNTYWLLVASKGDAALWNWQGTWEESNLYSIDDGVYYNGSSYICIVEHTSDTTTTPGIGVYWETYWDVVVRGLNWEGAWLTGTTYQEYDLVGSDSVAYICILGHTADATTEPGVGVYWETYWDAFAANTSTGGDEGTTESGVFDCGLYLDMSDTVASAKLTNKGLFGTDIEFDVVGSWTRGQSGTAYYWEHSDGNAGGFRLRPWHSNSVATASWNTYVATNGSASVTLTDTANDLEVLYEQTGLSAAGRRFKICVTTTSSGNYGMVGYLGECTKSGNDYTFNIYSGPHNSTRNWNVLTAAGAGTFGTSPQWKIVPTFFDSDATHTYHPGIMMSLWVYVADGTAGSIPYGVNYIGTYDKWLDSDPLLTGTWIEQAFTDYQVRFVQGTNSGGSANSLTNTCETDGKWVHIVAGTTYYPYYLSFIMINGHLVAHSSSGFTRPGVHLGLFSIFLGSVDNSHSIIPNGTKVAYPRFIIGVDMQKARNIYDWERQQLGLDVNH